MNLNQRNEFREAIYEKLKNLNRRRAELRNEVRKSNESQPSVTTNSIDHAADESSVIDLLLLCETSRNEEGHLTEALLRIERGDFGICSDCGDEISARRLQAVPAAIACLDCAQANEVAGRSRVQAPKTAHYSLENMKEDADETEFAS